MGSSLSQSEFSRQYTYAANSLTLGQPNFMGGTSYLLSGHFKKRKYITFWANLISGFLLRK
jgi:hypothetical protein